MRTEFFKTAEVPAKKSIKFAEVRRSLLARLSGGFQPDEIHARAEGSLGPMPGTWQLATIGQFMISGLLDSSFWLTKMLDSSDHLPERCEQAVRLLPVCLARRSLASHASKSIRH